MAKDYSKADVTIDSYNQTMTKHKVIKTGISELDYNLKGLGTGLTILTGSTGVGKSTLVQNIIARAVEQDVNTWIYAGEHSAEQFFEQFYLQNSSNKEHYFIPYDNESAFGDWKISQKAETSIHSKYDGKLRCYFGKIGNDIDTLLNIMAYNYNTNKTRFFIIDNLLSIKNDSAEYYIEQTSIINQLREFANYGNVPVLLVAHAKKTNSDRIQKSDVAGSMNVANFATNVLAIYRLDNMNSNSKGQSKAEYEKFIGDIAMSKFLPDKCDAVIEVLKTRGNKVGMVGLKYDKQNKTYIQSPKYEKTEADKRYKPVQDNILNEVSL